MTKLASTSFLILGLVFTSCLKEKTSPVDGCDTIISYSSEVRPIIESSCKTGLGGGTGCHDAWIDNYDEVASSIKSGSWPNAVFTLQTMPLIPNEFDIDSLTADEFQTMKCWVNQGYPNN